MLHSFELICCRNTYCIQVNEWDLVVNEVVNLHLQWTCTCTYKSPYFAKAFGNSHFLQKMLKSSLLLRFSL